MLDRYRRLGGDRKSEDDSGALPSYQSHPVPSTFPDGTKPPTNASKLCFGGLHSAKPKWDLTHDQTNLISALLTSNYASKFVPGKE